MRSTDEQRGGLRESSIAAPAAAGPLLERDVELHRMGTVLDAVQRTRAGATIVLRGEAGIGKTMLVEHFARLHSRRLHWLCGGCEALFAPRPLGPLVDLAAFFRGVRRGLEVYQTLRGFDRRERPPRGDSSEDDEHLFI